jgi:hypothetical protein
MLGDAALCAERVGTSSDLDYDRPASPGWRWLDAIHAVRDEATSHRTRLTTDQLIDRVASRLHVDEHAFAACRARLAGTTMTFIEATRRAGVRTTPATLVGGRIYGPITDPNTLQLLVDAELAPGQCDLDHGCLHLGDYAPAWRRGL